MDIDRFDFRWYYNQPEDDDDDEYDGYDDEDEEELSFSEMLDLEEDELVDVESLDKDIYELISYFEDSKLIKHFDFIDGCFRKMIRDEIRRRED